MARIEAQRAAQALVRLVPVRGFELMVGGVRAVQGPDGYPVAQALAGPLRDVLAREIEAYERRVEGLRNGLAMIASGRATGAEAPRLAGETLRDDERARAEEMDRRAHAADRSGAPPAAGDVEAAVMRYCGAERAGGAANDRGGTDSPWAAFLAGQRARETGEPCTPRSGPGDVELAWITGWKLVDDRNDNAERIRQLQDVVRDGLARTSDAELLAEVRRRGIEAGDTRAGFRGILAGKAEFDGVGFRGHGPGGGI